MSGSRRRRSRGSGRRGGTGSGCSTRTCRTRRPTWRSSGMPCPGFDAALGWRTTREDCWSKRLISRLANRVRNFGARPVDPGYGLLGPDLPARSGAAAPDVPGGPSVLRPAADPRGMPDRPGAGRPPPEDSWEVALPLRESVDPGRRRPARRRLAAPPADPVRGRLDPAESSADRPRLGRRGLGRSSDDGPGILAGDRVRRPGDLHGPVPCAVGCLGEEARLGGAGRLLVAEHPGRIQPARLRDPPARPGVHRRPGHGDGRLRAQPDARRPEEARRAA